jgi:hypothetical protein
MLRKGLLNIKLIKKSMQIKIEDFEKCLECWKTLYRLDDEIYKIILRELQSSDLTPKKTYTYIIRFLEIWGVRIAVNISEDELCSKIDELKQQLEQLIEPKQLELLKVNLDDLGQWIRRAFDQICSVRYVGPTSASKILHLLFPALFFIKMGAQKTRSFSSGMNGRGLNSSVLKALAMLLAERSPDMRCRQGLQAE